MCNRLADFYNGKSIFLTGAPGFLGSVLMEILLRCFPGINQIYILVRPKKGVKPEDRKKIIFQKKIFSQLLAEQPDIVDKVIVVPGDISLPHLGISEEDLSKIVQNVSIVFHCAASINFGLSIRVAVSINTMGAIRMMELCRKLKKCEAFVYTSTCYSNTHLPSETITEKVYKLPFTAEEFVNEYENGDINPFLEMLSERNYEWPNTYTFSKSLAENILDEKASDLPVAIVRPSIIHSTVDGPSPGYIEAGLAIVFISDIVAKGILHVVKSNPDAIIDLVPCDIASNMHVTAAWYIATRERCTSPFVVICNSGNIWKMKVNDYWNTVLKFSKKSTPPNAIQEASLIQITNDFLYNVMTFYKHTVPAFFLDFGRFLKGKKPKWMSVYVGLAPFLKSVIFFMCERLTFVSDNTEKLSMLLHPEDKQKIYLDIGKYTYEDMIFNVATGSTLYDWKKDKLSSTERKKKISVTTMITTAIRRFTLFLFIYIVYFIVKKFIF